MAHNNLGALYAKLGRVGDAIAEYEAALRIEPNVVEAETATRWGKSRVAKRRRCNICRAVRIAPSFAPAHYNLGIALAAIPGRAPEVNEMTRLSIPGNES